VLVTHTGIGTEAAAEAVTALLRAHTPTLLVAGGFAGALDPRLRVGDLVVATNYSQAVSLARAGERWADAPRVFFGPLATAAHPLETGEGKMERARETGALAVDMESSAIAAACQSRGIPLLALRAISDSANAPLPIPFAASYDLAAQRPRPWAIARHLFFHPSAALPLARFIRDLAVARTALTAGLVAYLADGTDGTNGTNEDVES
jgi:nucleoside phosphorylase